MPDKQGESDSAAGRRGRPRSEQSHLAVLRATSELLHEVGLRAMTTEEIAARSGVSKATIYKWWPNKYAVAVEAFLTEMMADWRDPQTGSATEDLRLVLRGLVSFYTGDNGRVFSELIGEAQFDSTVRTELHKHLMLAHRDLIKTVWARGIAAAQFRADVDPDDAIDVLIGPLLYRRLLGHPHLDDTAADTLVEVTLLGLSAKN
ncbi:TetR/AcrR family transcriptional regulator [Mycobacterium sp.]|uniref:TetR/AcrR family transcriptional regulator n=1 Tax=Mycobacterium sp. TaxID=1785 RepID=UPI002CECAAD3|nr:TetR/AcrR family transcriptional regulator [Mycobacterium sp.]HKP42974.1 TetR/AcrR family transcriptional regulator [Mycobacterium sp.]